MFHLIPCLFRVPKIIYAIMLYGGGFVALASAGALIWGAFRKKEKKYFTMWIGLFLFAIALIFLMTSGIILADTMFGGAV